MKRAIPWILLGTGALGLSALLVLRKKGPKALPPGGLTSELRAKVLAQIAASRDPAFLTQLAGGLQKTGAASEALLALSKSAAITGKPQTATASPTTYQVVAGDIPGAIAKRLGVGLSAIAKANPTSKTRIMAGQIHAGETLNLPDGVTDSGPANHANGAVA